jgi:ABC transport system ATP-binding/permease protein
VCDATWALPGDGSLVMLPGGVDEYLNRRAAAAAAEVAAVAAVGAESSDGGAPSHGEGARTRAARKELARIERQLAKLQQRIDGVHDEMAVHASDYQRLAELDAALDGLVTEHDALETAWLRAADGADPAR